MPSIKVQKAGQATVEVRPENVGTVDPVNSEQRSEPPKGKHCGKPSRIINGTLCIEVARFVPWVVVRLDAGQLGTDGLNGSSERSFRRWKKNSKKMSTKNPPPDSARPVT